MVMKKPIRYKTPKGVMEQLVEELDEDHRIINWHGFKIMEGKGKGPFFFDEIEKRRNENRSNMIVITGSPGEGKSYFGLRLGEIFDPKFDVNVQVVFERLDLLKLIGPETPLKRGQVIVVDEAQFIAGSRRWYEEIQKDLMEHLEAVRSKGFVIIIVALHLNLLDVIIRKYVLSFMIHMEKRGLGIVYHLYTPRFEREMYRRRLGKLGLKLPDNDKCDYPDCLECKARAYCNTTRAVYERRKTEFLGSKSKEASQKEYRKESQKMSDEDIMNILDEHQNELKFSTKGELQTQIKLLAKKHKNIELTGHRCRAIRILWEIKSKETTTS